MVQTNMLSPMLLCQSLVPLLKQREQAAIVNIGSIFGSIGHPGFTAYCATKFGLRGFTEALQRELADSSVRVSYLAPRATRTDLNSEAVTALNEALGNATDTPEHVAAELMRVLGQKRRQRYMGWPESLFVRLNGLFPGLVHNALTRKLHIIRQHATRHHAES
jgi:short-subunit dehydrogenase